jgi:phosphonate transport system substrate-binding protein
MKFIKLLLFFVVLLTFSCAPQAELGTKKNPIKMYFVPSMEAGKIVTSGKEVADYITQETGYRFKVAVPTSQKFGAEVALTAVRKGLDKYKGQFIAQTDSGINSLEDIDGKIIAYTDAASTSGFMYPSALLAKKGIKPEKYFFAGGHPQSILAVYDGKADVGCTFWAPEGEDGPRDARRAVIETYPDVMEKIKIVGFTDWIPNDTVTFRKDFPKDMKEKIVDTLLKYASTKEGHETLVKLLDIDNFVRSTDADYDVVRQTLKAIGRDASDLVN